MDFVQMHPDFSVVVHAPGLQVQAISQPGVQYAMVFTGVASNWVKLSLLKGKYNFEFVSPYSGVTLQKGSFNQKKNGVYELSMPGFGEMVALKITK
jgi:hypothetical protein